MMTCLCVAASLRRWPCDPVYVFEEKPCDLIYEAQCRQKQDAIHPLTVLCLGPLIDSYAEWNTLQSHSWPTVCWWIGINKRVDFRQWDCRDVGEGAACTYLKFYLWETRLSTAKSLPARNVWPQSQWCRGFSFLDSEMSTFSLLSWTTARVTPSTLSSRGSQP